MKMKTTVREGMGNFRLRVYCGLNTGGKRLVESDQAPEEDLPSAKGMCTSLIRDKSDAYARSDERSSCRACCRLLVGARCASEEDEDEGATSSSRLIDTGESSSGAAGKALFLALSSRGGSSEDRPLSMRRLRGRIGKTDGRGSSTIEAKSSMSSGGGVAGLRMRMGREVVGVGTEAVVLVVMVELLLMDFEMGRSGERTGTGGATGWSTCPECQSHSVPYTKRK